MGEVVRFPHGGGSLTLIILLVLGSIVILPCDGLNPQTRAHCKNPQDCCRFARSTQEFHSCCHDHGCCPINCDDSLEEDVADSGSCGIAWSCCRYRPQSQDFKHCCQKYGCSPACGETSQGCCYNGKIYAWGVIVEEFPDSCMQLVCAAQTTTVKLLAAVIVPVKQPLCSCKESAACEDSLEYSCVDETGLVQPEGATWEPDYCHQCQCLNSTIKCHQVEVQCPPAPHKYCLKIPGPCCSTWNCSVGCTDEGGEQKELGSSWYSHPCLYHTCTIHGVVTKQEECFLTPPEHPSCEEFTPEGKCCQQWRCSGCTDTSGTYYELDYEWTGSDPCIVQKCTKDGIKETLKNCSAKSPPHPGCHSYTPAGACCLQWNCSGCVDGTGYHPLFDIWKSDPCTTNVCMKTGIQSSVTECQLGPAPHTSCQRYNQPEKCCPEWKCSGCLDSAGSFHHLGQEWTMGSACYIFKCNEEGITMKLVQCTEDSPPHQHCSQYTPVGDCCPKWNCSACIDHNGQQHSLYEVWRTDLCTTNFCTKTGVETTRDTCDLGPAPHPSCKENVPLGECCPEWICSGCFDSSGNHHAIDQKWSTGDPCLMFVCTEEGIVIERFLCIDTLPHHSCHEYKPVGECCSKWNCSACIDVTGTSHSLYDLWKTDPCTTHYCTRNGIQTTSETCTVGPAPHPSCQEVTQLGECCSEWQCRACLDGTGEYHDLGSKWSKSDLCVVFSCTEAGIVLNRTQCEETPPPHSDCYKYTAKGECCPKWNCSGCVDATLKYHPLHDVWKPDQCTTRVCARDGIQTTRENCQLEPTPHQSCKRQIPIGQCCPVWNCSGCFVNQKYYNIGAEWVAQDACMIYTCTQEGIKVNSVKCTKTLPPHPGCREYTPDTECCPTWNCSGCTDVSGKFHVLNDIWKTDPCTTRHCTKAGILTTIKECTVGQAPDRSCVKLTTPGECCPQWKCRGCLDKDGKYRDVGEDWSTDDPCTRLFCTEGIITVKRTDCKITLAPHPDCYEYTPSGECCQKWNCSGCIDKGVYYPLYKVWKDDPCTTKMCTGNGIQITTASCFLGPAPHPSCQKVAPPGKCCPEWKCRGCFDATGNFHDLGQEWSTEDPCMLLVCTEGGILPKFVACIDSKPPQIDCSRFIPFGECCPKWNCSGCTDSNGAYHRLSEIWKPDACTTKVCTNVGIKTTVKNCSLGVALHPTCQNYTPPGECCPEWKCSGCIDYTGAYHELYSVWKTDPCTTQTCTSDGVETTEQDCRPKPAPHTSCQKYNPPGECCSRWNCSGCTEDTGIYHPLHEVWHSDSCTLRNCTSDGIKTTVKVCHLGPAPHTICKQYTAPAQCCPEWQCRGCIDWKGEFHELGHKWSTDDPCLLLVCTEDDIDEEIVHCPETLPPRPGCSKYRPPGECCSMWNCSGCTDNSGSHHQLYEVWRTDSCTTHFCTRGGIKTNVETCSLGPALHPSCQKNISPGECCPEWKCSGCLDYDGKYHQLNEEWSSDPCTAHVCTSDGLKSTMEDCFLGPAPHPDCQKSLTPGHCCPEWNCSGCTDHNGTYHNLHDVWKSDPCTTETCKLDGIATTVEECYMGPAFHPSCREYIPKGECCPEWECSGCTEDDGTYHPLHAVWKHNSCTTHTCTVTGVKATVKDCHLGPALHPTCQKFTPPGECCPEWKCSGCTDNNGTYHPLQESWRINPCTTQACTTTGINTTVEKCDLGPAPHSSCKTLTSLGKCCPEWTCGGCLGEDLQFHEVGDEWSTSDPCRLLVCTAERIMTKAVSCIGAPRPHPGCIRYTPLGKCCPEWNCSGCVDKNGTYHPDNKMTKIDACTTITCTNNVLVTMKEVCVIGVAPHPACRKNFTKEQCCPTWNCSGCIEKSGKHHDLHEHWQTSDCISHKCTLEGIQTTVINCLDPPHSNCIKFPLTGNCCPEWHCGQDCSKISCLSPPGEDCNVTTPPLACCPVWNCSGCYDTLGNYQPLGSEWQDNECTLSQCTLAGVKVKGVTCSDVPLPHPGCVPYTPVGECCPKWKCRNCVDYLGGPHNEGEVWQDPHNPCKHCACRGGSVSCVIKDCPPPPPWPCDPERFPGQCCPNYCSSPASNMVTSIFSPGKHHG